MKYAVTLYFHTSATIEVDAENEEEALETAYETNMNKELLAGLIEDGSPEVRPAN